MIEFLKSFSDSLIYFLKWNYVTIILFMFCLLFSRKIYYQIDNLIAIRREKTFVLGDTLTWFQKDLVE